MSDKQQFISLLEKARDINGGQRGIRKLTALNQTPVLRGLEGVKPLTHQNQSYGVPHTYKYPKIGKFTPIKGI